MGDLVTVSFLVFYALRGYRLPKVFISLSIGEIA